MKSFESLKLLNLSNLKISNKKNSFFEKINFYLMKKSKFPEIPWIVALSKWLRLQMKKIAFHLNKHGQKAIEVENDRLNQILDDPLAVLCSWSHSLSLSPHYFWLFLLCSFSIFCCRWNFQAIVEYVKAQRVMHNYEETVRLVINVKFV